MFTLNYTKLTEKEITRDIICTRAKFSYVRCHCVKHPITAILFVLTDIESFFFIIHFFNSFIFNC